MQNTLFPPSCWVLDFVGNPHAQKSTRQIQSKQKQWGITYFTGFGITGEWTGMSSTLFYLLYYIHFNSSQFAPDSLLCLLQAYEDVIPLLLPTTNEANPNTMTSPTSSSLSSHTRSFHKTTILYNPPPLDNILFPLISVNSLSPANLLKMVTDIYDYLMSLPFCLSLFIFQNNLLRWTSFLTLFHW